MTQMNINQVCKKLQNIIEIRVTDNNGPIVIGISGGQGSGKSTLSQLLSKNLNIKGILTIVLSLDDFYLTKNERKKLSKKIHPLALRRGVPGTHDTDFLKKILKTLLQKTRGLPIELPIFEKGLDDRKPKRLWKQIKRFPSVILLEGWCIGALSDNLASTPETDWELINDPNGIWKKWTKTEAKKYEEIWEALDYLIFIEQENFAQVIEDRWRQEQKIIALNQSNLLRTKNHVEEFCKPFESWTNEVWNFNRRHANVILSRDLNYNYIWTQNKDAK